LGLFLLPPAWFVAGCGSSQSTTIWSAGTAGDNAAKDYLKDWWPAALQAAVLWNQNGFAVVGSTGVRFKELFASPESPGTTTSAGADAPQRRWSLESIVLNRRLDRIA
jgi:hypothetical protein